MKLTHKLTRHMNIYTSQQVFSIHIQPKQNILILKEDNNTSDNFASHENEKSTLKKQDIEKDYRNLVDKSSDIRSHVKDNLSGYTP